MAGKGFTCEVDLSLHLISSIGNYECCGEYVYVTVEMFGTVHKTRPQRSYYPLIFNEVVNFSKTFWSPSTEREVLENLADSTVSIELRKIDPCFFNGLLLAYYDGNARDFLFSPYPRMPCTLSGNEVFMDRTVDFKGTAPRLRYSSFADIKRIGSSFTPSYSIENLAEKKQTSKYNRYDDGYDSPEPVSTGKVNSRSSRQRERSPSPAGGYYQRQTVSSALRSRSASPIPGRLGGVRDRYQKDFDDNEEEAEDGELGATQDSGLGFDEGKPPFVVRKVPDNLLTSAPENTSYSRRRNSRQRTRGARSNSRTRLGQTTSNSTSNLRRSCSVQNKLNKHSTETTGGSANISTSRSASPSPVRTRVSDLLESYRSPRHYGHSCCSYSHRHHYHSPYYSSPLVDYYTDRLRRLTNTSYHHLHHYDPCQSIYCGSHGCTSCW